MNTQAIGFIGGGRIARILLGGWKRAGCRPARVVVHDPDPAVLAGLRAEHPDIIDADVATAAGQAIVLLAVHPPALAAVLEAVRPVLAADALVVSLAPKWTLRRIADALGGHASIARVIPNAGSLVGAGFNPLAFGPGVAVPARTALRDLLAPLGEAPEVAESKLEAYALLTAMGPTCLWFQWLELLRIAEETGLSRDKAIAGLRRMLCGSARTLFESGLAPAAVLDLVPVKPLAADEEAILAAYRQRLPALYEKIKP